MLAWERGKKLQAHYERALAIAEAIEFPPAIAQIRAGQAQLLAHEGKGWQARRALSRVLETEEALASNSRIEVLWTRAWVHIQREEWAAAEEDVAAAIDMYENPDNSHYPTYNPWGLGVVYRLRGVLLAHAGEYEAAETYFDKSLGALDTCAPRTGTDAVGICANAESAGRISRCGGATE